MAGISFDDTDAMTGAARTSEGKATAAELLQDERRFIDLTRSVILLAEERYSAGREGSG